MTVNLFDKIKKIRYNIVKRIQRFMAQKRRIQLCTLDILRAQIEKELKLGESVKEKEVRT